MTLLIGTATYTGRPHRCTFCRTPLDGPRTDRNPHCHRPACIAAHEAAVEEAAAKRLADL